MQIEDILQKIDKRNLEEYPTDPCITKNCTNTIFYKSRLCNFAIRAIDDNYLCKYHEFFRIIFDKREELTVSNFIEQILACSGSIERKHLTECTIEEINNEIAQTTVNINNANVLYNELKIIDELCTNNPKIN